MKIYKIHIEKMKILIIHGILSYVCWIIEAKVRLIGELFDSFISYISGLGKSIYTKKRITK